MTLYDRIRFAVDRDVPRQVHERQIPVWSFINDLWLYLQGLQDGVSISSRWALDAGQRAEMRAYMDAARTRVRDAAWKQPDTFNHWWQVFLAAQRGMITQEQFTAELLKES